MNKIDVINELYNEDLAFWKKMLDKYLISGHRVIIRGKPSIKKLQILLKEKEDRIQKRRALLGEEGLKRKAVELFKAKLEYEVNVLINITNSRSNII